MKKPFAIFFLTFLCWTCFSLQGMAQHYPNISFGIGPEALSYRGDLNESYSQWNAGLRASVLFAKKNRFNSELSLGIGKIVGQNSSYVYEGDASATPATFVATNYVDFSYRLRLNILAKKRYRLYIGQGIGLMRFSPKDESGEQLKDQFESLDLGESYSAIALILPTQLGFTYQLPNDFGFSAQASFLNPMTDYLDNLGEWGNSEGNDKIIAFNVMFWVPLKSQQQMEITPRTGH